MTHIVKVALSKADETVLVLITDEELPEGYEELGRAAAGTHLLAIDNLLDNGYGVKSEDVTIKYSDKAEEHLNNADKALATNPDLSSQHQEIAEQTQNPEPVPVTPSDDQVVETDPAATTEPVGDGTVVDTDETDEKVATDEAADDQTVVAGDSVAVDDDSAKSDEDQTEEEKKDAE